MDEHHGLPFKVGQLAESKSFEKGYRGAWFRCKIKEISRKKYQIGYTLEFYDFPDEEVNWTRLYQVPPYGRKSKEFKRHLMMRPCYPPMYYECQMPHVNSTPEVAVIVEGSWKVGSLVDWHEKDCYWSGRVIKVLDDDNVKIELPLPPAGEGGYYDASCKDLRPSLDWSPEYGWRVPTLDGENSCCARLIHPVNQAVDALPNIVIPPTYEGILDVLDAAGSPLNASFSSHISANSLPAPRESEEAPQTPQAKTDLDFVESVFGKASSSDSVSTSHAQDAKPETTGLADLFYSGGSLSAGETIPLNSLCSDTLEVAILNLEELINKVKWIKRILEYGIPLSSDTRSSWTFVEHRSSSKPK